MSIELAVLEVKVTMGKDTLLIIILLFPPPPPPLPSIRSESDMFSFLMSQWRPDPPKPDLEALDNAVVQAECQGNSNT